MTEVAAQWVFLNQKYAKNYTLAEMLIFFFKFLTMLTISHIEARQISRKYQRNV